MDTQGWGTSLREAFGEVPDPRSRQGQRHPLAAVLTLMTVAMLSGARSLYAIAQWGRLQEPEVVAALGFATRRTPAVSTLHEMTRRLDPTALEAVLARWAQGEGVAPGRGIALDGKVLRGSHAKGAPPSQWIDGVAGYTHEAGRVLAQAGVSGDKREAELTVAPRLLTQIPVQGAVITGDALYCQRTLCQQILAAGGDYLFFGKGNQPTLAAAIALVFTQPPPGERFVTVTEPHRHGSRWEVRELTTTAALAGYLDWPGVQQVGRLVRRWEEHDQTGGEVRLLITSLSAEVPPATVLRLARGHWQIENSLHYPRDVTLGEDASRIRSGAAPQVMAALRNVVLTLVRATGATTIAAALRAIAWRGTALAMLGIPLS